MDYIIETSDIANFWKAYEMLSTAKTRQDSIDIIQNQYREKASEDFKADLDSDPKDYSNWLYNRGKVKDRPADLGYFIGYKIVEVYYQKQNDKSKAIRQILNQKKYMKIIKESGYLDKNCS